MKRRGAWIWVVLAASTALGQTPGARREVSVAAASNLNDVFREAGAQFEAATGIHPVFSFAATAQLTQQVENGAPFDVIAGADTEHIEALDQKGLLTAGSKAVYAIGVLALWVPPGSRAKITSIADVASPDVKVIAIAKPELAPYGDAAVESLRHAGLWEKVQARVVYGENISVVRQYGASGNADVVFTAYSLVMKEPGKVLQVGDEYHKPIAQALGIVKASKNAEAARAFAEFLLRGKGREILTAYGYRTPR
jgi:molybdate transport system substrate-binding protein